jgi:hypothetical protein
MPTCGTLRAFDMRFHVAREGAVVGEFEEQTFRNKVFSGEIIPTDSYWRVGFSEWRPVSEFRVARKTEKILMETARSLRSEAPAPPLPAVSSRDCRDDDHRDRYASRYERHGAIHFA